jgi:hypothetical protein
MAEHHHQQQQQHQQQQPCGLSATTWQDCPPFDSQRPPTNPTPANATLAPAHTAEYKSSPPSAVGCHSVLVTVTMPGTRVRWRLLGASVPSSLPLPSCRHPHLGASLRLMLASPSLAAALLRRSCLAPGGASTHSAAAQQHMLTASQDWTC